MGEFVDLTNARTDKYKGVLEKIKSDKVCPFCRENFEQYSKEPVILETDTWYAAKNSYSYQESALALIVVLKRHLESLSEVRDIEWLEGLYFIRALIEEFKVEGGGLVVRFGDTRYTGATVKHLHFHLIVPEIKNRKAVPVYFPIG